MPRLIGSRGKQRPHKNRLKRTFSMQYMIILNETKEHFDMRNGQTEVAQAYWGAWSAYTAEMCQAGIVVSGSGLQAPHTASVVTVRDGVRHVEDGPFADTKEQLGGYFIIEVSIWMPLWIELPKVHRLSMQAVKCGQSCRR